MRVYVAGPITGGDVFANVRNAVAAGDALMSSGHSPYVPHLSAFWDMMHAHSYEDWMRLDLEWLAACDVLVRLPGESPGADREVAFAKEHGIPVIDGVAGFLLWAEACRYG